MATAASARLRVITGPDQNHLAHATVYMRLQGVDAKWQFFGQDWQGLQQGQVLRKRLNS